jgi:hypothetical protein
MLTDQTFLPRPTIGIGPELFWSPGAPGNYDFQTIRIFRQCLLQVPFFIYQYVALENSQYGNQHEFAEGLRAMDLPFPVFLFQEKQGHVRAAKIMVRSLDALYSPEFSAKIFVPNQINYNCGKEAFLQALRFFQEDTPCYTPVFFRNLTDRLWTTEQTKRLIPS